MQESKELYVTKFIDIAASATQVWRMLTDPKLTEQYMFGCRAQSDWQVGSPLRWAANVEGREQVFVKGTVLAFEPGRLLTYTIFAPASGLADVPENYLTIRCRLEPRGHSTRLEITQGDYAKVANGEERYRENQGGADDMLAKMKSVAETA